jgi:hypothetical protein
MDARAGLIGAGSPLRDVASRSHRRVAGVSVPALTAAVLALALVAASSAGWLAVTSDHLARPGATALYKAYLVAAPMLVGIVWWRRRPESRFGPLLLAFGVCGWGLALQSADEPGLYAVGVAFDAPFIVLKLLAVPRVSAGPAPQRRRQGARGGSSRSASHSSSSPGTSSRRPSRAADRCRGAARRAHRIRFRSRPPRNC